MRIEINVVHDDGTTITIGHNERLSSGGSWIWATKFDSDALRGLTSEQSWAASFLCMTAACQRLPIPASHTASIAAANAWNDHKARECDKTSLAVLAAEMEKANRREAERIASERPDGAIVTSADGDVQHTTT